MGKILGQHFLKDSGTLNKIVDGLNLKNGETVVEIGPGHGELTYELGIRSEELRGKRGKLKILAIEKDPQLANFSKNKFSDDKNIEIVEGDALLKLPEITSELGEYKLVGNIPYYITGYLFRVIERLENKPKICVFTIQKEVAERIVAKPPKTNKLSASIQFWSEPEILGIVPRKLFSPPPEVDSAIIKIVTHNMYHVTSESYYKMINALFKQPRKTILNNFSGGLGLKKEEIGKILAEMGLEASLRPQNLGVETIAKMTKNCEAALKDL